MNDFTALYVAINYKAPLKDEHIARKQFKALQQQLSNLRAVLSPLRSLRNQQ
jgi:hypothetical protein